MKDKLERAEKSLKEITDITKDNIDKVLGRTLQLEILTEKSSKLKFRSKKLSYQAKKLRYQA